MLANATMCSVTGVTTVDGERESFIEQPFALQSTASQVYTTLRMCIMV